MIDKANLLKIVEDKELKQRCKAKGICYNCGKELSTLLFRTGLQRPACHLCDEEYIEDTVTSTNHGNVIDVRFMINTTKMTEEEGHEALEYWNGRDGR